MREKRLYRLIVAYPDGSDEPDWEPEGWDQGLWNGDPDNEPARSCPNCGRGIAINRFACPGCWRRLPYPLKKPILDAYNRRDWPAHKTASDAATAWYAANRA